MSCDTQILGAGEARWRDLAPKYKEPGKARWRGKRRLRHPQFRKWAWSKSDMAGERVQGTRVAGGRVQGTRVAGERVQGTRLAGGRVQGTRVAGGPLKIPLDAVSKKSKIFGFLSERFGHISVRISDMACDVGIFYPCPWYGIPGLPQDRVSIFFLSVSGFWSICSTVFSTSKAI